MHFFTPLDNLRYCGVIHVLPHIAVSSSRQIVNHNHKESRTELCALWDSGWNGAPLGKTVQANLYSLPSTHQNVSDPGNEGTW